MKKILSAAVVALVMAVLCAADASAQRQQAPQQPSKPQIIYVMDFEIDAGGISQGSGLLERRRMRQQDPEEKAERFVEILSTSLVDELLQKSVRTARLFRGQNLPNSGWLVTGQFLEADEGNRMRRAMVGFGAGAAEMQVEVAVIDLASGQREPFLVFGTDAKSGRGPGAVVMMNPYVAAAKFVMSKRAPEKDIRKTAGQIADVLVRYIDESRLRPN